MRLASIALLSVTAISLGCSNDSLGDMTAPQLDPAADPAAGSSISGHGEWINPAGELVSRSFHARVMPDGSVQGEFVQCVTALNGDRRPNRGDLNCLRFITDNDAVVSGPILVNENPDLIGVTQIFRVRDAGEGAEADDRMSSVFFREPITGLDCQSLTPPETNMRPLEGGNLQVRR